MPGLPSQSRFRSPAPPKGEPLAGRATSHWTPEARYGAKGRALLAGAAASGQRSLSSCRWPRQRSTAASEILCFARPDESWPTCQWLPLWGSWRAQARLRGLGRCQTALHSDSIALTKSLPIAAQRLFPAGLALSVTFGDTSPRGRGFGRRKNHSIVICSPSSSARTSAPVAGRLRTR